MIGRYRVLTAVAVVLIAAAPLSGDEWLSGGVDLEIVGFSAYSTGWVEYQSGLITGSCGFSGTHAIHDGGAGVVSSRAISGCQNTPYSGSVSAGTIYSHCYQAFLDVYGQRGASNTYGSARRCADPQTGGGTGDGHFHNEGGSPLVVNLARGGRWEFSGTNDPVLFDLDADGTAERWAWTAPGTAIAFVALDRNRNGRIDNGAELFGDQTGANGFELLRTYDTSGDRQITAADAIWPQLLLWTDANHNGTSEPGELSSLAASDIQALGLDYHWSARNDRDGTAFRYQAVVRIAGRAEPYFDVYFLRAR